MSRDFDRRDSRDYDRRDYDRRDYDRGDRGGGGSRRRSRSRDGGGARDGATTSLLVRNLSFDITPEDLRKLFDKYGDIRDVYIPQDFYTRKPRGFAFVEFYDYRDARAGYNALNGYKYDGRELTILYAKDKRKSADQMRAILSRGRSNDRGAERYPDRRDRRDDRPERDDRDARGGDRRDYDDRRSPSPRRSRSRSRSPDSPRDRNERADSPPPSEDRIEKDPKENEED